MADLSSALKSLRALTNLEEGWLDGDSGEKVLQEAIAGAARIAQEIASRFSVVPAVFPTEDGGVQLAYGEHGALTVDVEPNGSVYIHAADVAQGRSWAVSMPPTLHQLPRPVADRTVCSSCSHANYAHCPRNGCRAIVGKDGNDFVLCDCKEAR